MHNHIPSQIGYSVAAAITTAPTTTTTAPSSTTTAAATTAAPSTASTVIGWRRRRRSSGRHNCAVVSTQQPVTSRAECGNIAAYRRPRISGKLCLLEIGVCYVLHEFRQGIDVILQ